MKSEMTNTEMRRIFNHHVKGKNLMTPTQIEFRYVEGINSIVEISYGDGLTGEGMYGITFLELSSKHRPSAINKAVKTMKEVENYLDVVSQFRIMGHGFSWELHGPENGCTSLANANSIEYLFKSMESFVEGEMV